VQDKLKVEEIKHLMHPAILQLSQLYVTGEGNVPVGQVRVQTPFDK
jgi:hypothetical protein